MDAMPSDVTGGWVCRRSCRTDFFEGRRIFFAVDGNKRMGGNCVNMFG